MKRVYDGFYKIDEFEATVGNKTGIYENVVLHDAVAALVVNENNEVALVKQYRPTLDRYTYEIPAGIVDKSISNYEIMIEELEEECNINRENIDMSSEPILTFDVVTGASGNELSIYYVKVKNTKGKIIENDDVEEVLFVSKVKLKEMMDKGIIRDTKTMLAYYKYLELGDL